MSNPVHHQLLTVTAFTGGLLWAVASLFSQASGEGVIDRATKSIIARAKPAAYTTTDSGGAEEEMANNQWHSNEAARFPSNSLNKGSNAPPHTNQNSVVPEPSYPTPISVDEESQSRPAMDDIKIYK